jgi:heme-degrading monooxygenase HmoA
MTQTSEVTDFVSSDVPAREFGYPRGVTHVVFAQFGVQANGQGHGEDFIKEMRALFSAADGPIRVERCHGFNTAGIHEDILMTYWTHKEDYERWYASAAFTSWWSELPNEGPLGYWRENMTPDVDHVGFIGFGLEADRLVGCTHAMGAVPSQKWGYWGNYRDRFAASKHDRLESPLGTELPEPVVRDTRGRRVKIIAPHNLCFVREGQESTYITTATERELWDVQLKPALDKWIEYLMQNPRLSGAAVTRNTIEQDLETGEDKEKYTELSYLLTLRHLERASRTQPSHVALYNTYMGMLDELAESGVPTALMTWVEQHILEEGCLDAEYINCHPNSGLLPWFDARYVS